MPEFSVREVRLPELHLPEIKRDDIVRSLSGIHIPEVDLAKARTSRIRLPAITVTGSDLGRLLAAGAALARFSRPARARRPWLTRLSGRRTRWPAIQIVQPRGTRSRRPIVLVALLVAAVGGLLFLRRPVVRARVEAAVHLARQQVAMMAGHRPGEHAIDERAAAPGDAAPIEATMVSRPLIDNAGALATEDSEAPGSTAAHADGRQTSEERSAVN